MSDEKQYLGDGAFVHFEGENVVLTTSDGRGDTNRIVLEPEVMAVFLIRVSHWKAKKVEASREADRLAALALVGGSAISEDGNVAFIGADDGD